MKNKEILVFSVFFMLLVNGCSDTGSFSQPIAYNHKKHVEDAGLSCFDCHALASTHEKASIPNISICANCHADPMTESKEEKKLVNYIKNNQLIPWVQVHRVPDHAYFSHRRHVALGKIACQDCHGDVSAMTLPFSKPHSPIKMEFCIDCHKKKSVGIDCATCHR